MHLGLYSHRALAHRAIVVSLLLTASVWSADWNAFRGPNGDGKSDVTNLPHQWSSDTNLLWKQRLPRAGNGSPIVSAGRLFVTSAEDEEGRQRSLYCLDTATGQQQWVQTVSIDKTMPTHKTNPYAGSTPVSNGKRVVVWHASAGLYCYDHQGVEQWSRQFGEFRHMWGYGSSPIIFGDMIILYSGPGQRIIVAAVDLDSGEVRWEVEEPQEGDGEKNLQDKYMGSWATPVVANVNGQDQIVCSMPTRLVAYEPQTGEIIWTCDGIRGDRGDLAYSSPMISDELCVAIGGFGGPGLGLRLGGVGDVTHSHRLWRTEKNPQNIGTGIFLGKHIYRANAGPGTIDCLDATTGEMVWSDRGEGANHWASVVYAEEHLFATNQDGTTVVFKANPEAFQEVSVNELGESVNATPALADGRIYIRGSEHVYCIGRE